MHWTRKSHSIIIKSSLFVTNTILEIKNIQTSQAVAILKIHYTSGSLSCRVTIQQISVHRIGLKSPRLPLPNLVGCVQGSFALCPWPWHCGGPFIYLVHFRFAVTKCVIVFYLSMLRRHKNCTKLIENTFSHHKISAIKRDLKKNFCSIFTLEWTQFYSLRTQRGGCALDLFKSGLCHS